MATKINPLDAYVTTKPANWSMDFKLPPMPSLRSAISGQNLLDGLSAHDEAQEQWRVNAEQSISERIREAVAAAAPAATTTTTTLVTTAPTVTPPATPAPPASGFVISVNTKTGIVVLKSDDIPEGSINFYLTQMRFLAMFDAFGFHVNDIPAGATVHVPSARNLVMTGPLSVEGFLTVDGYLRAL